MSTELQHHLQGSAEMMVMGLQGLCFFLLTVTLRFSSREIMTT